MNQKIKAIIEELEKKLSSPDDDVDSRAIKKHFLSILKFRLESYHQWLVEEIIKEIESEGYCGCDRCYAREEMVARIKSKIF
jgi:hypothetical protein